MTFNDTSVRLMRGGRLRPHRLLTITINGTNDDAGLTVLDESRRVKRSLVPRRNDDADSVSDRRHVLTNDTDVDDADER